MSRPVPLLSFMSIVILVMTCAHYYLWARLIRDTVPTVRFRRIATTLLVALGISLPITMIFLRRGGLGPAAWVSFSWLGLTLFLVVATAATDLVYLAMHATGSVDPARRTVLRRTLAGVASAVAFSTGAAAIVEALRRTRVVDITVPLRRLPKAFDGFTIVQLTDIHVGQTIGRAFIEGLVERVNAMSPDLVAITGDLVDGSVARLGHAIAPLGALNSKHGTFFVTGNHEYYSGATEWVAALKTLDVRVLRNERIAIERGGVSFDLAGVDDWSSHGKAPGHGRDLPRALLGYDRSRELVLLAHQPKQAIEAAQLGVGLQLSGHTHGGQIWPFTYAVHLQQPFVAGLDRIGEFFIYTSRGTGYWGPPMRLAAPAEITRITLRAVG